MSKPTVNDRRSDRRRFLNALAGSGVTIGLTSICAAATPAASSRGFLVGTGIADITPPLEVGILMSSGRKLWEPFDGMRLPLQARAIVIGTPERRIAIVSLDLLGIAGEAVGSWAAFKKGIVAACKGSVAARDLVVTSTHTHGGPESIALTELFHREAFKNWADDLCRKIGLAVNIAAQSMEPCRLMIAQHAAPGLSVNRRIKTTQGIASVRRQLPPEVVIGPEGPTDDDVRVAAFVGPSGTPRAIVVNYTAHPVLEMCIKQVSPDYPGELVRAIEQRHRGSVALFLQGACGNINPPTMERSAENSKRYARRLADIVDKALSDAVPAKGKSIELQWKVLSLSQRDAAGKPLPTPLETEIAAARVGNAAVVFLPGEPFVETALAIREASPWPMTMVVGYSEDYIGYIPTDSAFDNGGYEIGPGRWSRVDRGSEPIVRREAIALLKSLR